MLPGIRAPISATRKRVEASQRSAVSGSPISLLNDPCGATVGPRSPRSTASRSFVLVLPDDPVTPTTTSPGRAPTTCRASAPSASS